MGNRNSYSKTDVDATFMRIKDDRLLPAYNVMIGTENQFILNYSIYQKSSESDLFINHMENMRVLPKAITGAVSYTHLDVYKRQVFHFFLNLQFHLG